jgi:hypothetical protein
MTIIGNDNKLNSSKFKTQRLEHSLMKNNYIKKHPYFKFRLDGDVG